MKTLLTALLLSLATTAEPDIVRDAPSSPEWTWEVITSPHSSSADRRAVAARAGKALDPSWLPKIEAARLQHVRDPEAGNDNPGDPPGASVIRSRVPRQWQVPNALDAAWDSVLEEADIFTFEEWALSIPCESKAEARFFATVTTDYVRRHPGTVSVEMAGARRNLLRRGVRFVDLGSTPWTFRDDPDLWPIGHVLALDRLEAGDLPGPATDLAALRGKRVRYTAAMAVARRLIADESHSLRDRARAAWDVLAALGEKPLSGDAWGSSDEHDEEALREFEDWFATREDVLARAAAAEAEAVDRARNTLDRVRQCAAGERLPSP